MTPERLQEIRDMANGTKDGYWLIPSTVHELIEYIDQLREIKLPPLKKVDTTAEGFIRRRLARKKI